MNEKRDLILASAKQIFIRFGYHKTTMNDIASEARMGKGSMYYYFKSKEELFLNVVQNEASGLFLQLKNSLSKITDPRIRFQRSITLPLELFTRSKILIMTWNVDKGFLEKVKQFTCEKDNHILQIITESLSYAQSKGILKEEYDIEETATLFHRWFFLNNQKMKMKLDESKIHEILRDYHKLAKIMVWGIQKPLEEK